MILINIKRKRKERIFKMSLIPSLKKRTITAGLSSALILSQCCAPSINAINPNANPPKTATPLEISQAMNYSEFREVTKYLEVKINFKLKNSVYLKDIYLAAYQGVVCLNVYKAVDPGTFEAIKDNLLTSTIDLIKIFKFFSAVCPLKQEVDYSARVKSLEKFLVENLDVKEEEFEDTKILTRKKTFPNMTWRRDLKSRIFMILNSKNFFENDFFSDLINTIIKINTVSVNLYKRIHENEGSNGKEDFNSLIAINTLRDLKLKDAIFPIKKLYYEEKLKPANIHSGTFYYNPTDFCGKIKEGRNKISIDDYINVLTLNILDYAYLKNNLGKELQKNIDILYREKISQYYHKHSLNKEDSEAVREKIGKEAWDESSKKIADKYNKMLRKILFLISYYNECISCADMERIPELREKISKIENELIVNHLSSLRCKDVMILDDDAAKLKSMIKSCSNFYAENLKNNMIPLDVTKADLDYYSIVEENDPSYKILKEKPLGIVRKIIYKSLKKYDDQFRPYKIFAYDKNLKLSLVDLLEALNDLRPKKKNKNTTKFRKSPNELIELALEEARREQEDPEAARRIREYRKKMDAQKRSAKALVKKEYKKQQILRDMKFERDFKIHKSNGQILTLKRIHKLKKLKEAFQDFKNKKIAPIE